MRVRQYYTPLMQDANMDALITSMRARPGMYIATGESGIYNTLIRACAHLQSLGLSFTLGASDNSLAVGFTIQGLLFPNRIARCGSSHIWEKHTSLSAGRRDPHSFEDWLTPMMVFSEDYQCRLYAPHIGRPLQSLTYQGGILEDTVYRDDDPAEGETTITWAPFPALFYDEDVPHFDLYKWNNPLTPAQPILCGPPVEMLKVDRPYHRDAEGFICLDQTSHQVSKDHRERHLELAKNQPASRVRSDILKRIQDHFNPK